MPVAERCPEPGASLALAHPGAVALSRTGDPDLGEFGPAEILALFGDVPEELSEL